MSEIKEDQYAQEFITRSMRLLDQYESIREKLPAIEQHESVLLLNCLLGLLVLPKEHLLDEIDAIGEESFASYGLPQNVPSYIYWGNWESGVESTEQETLKHFVVGMRHAVAHHNITILNEFGQIHSVCFENEKGFRATLEVSTLRRFVMALGSKLSEKRLH